MKQTQKMTPGSPVSINPSSLTRRAPAASSAPLRTPGWRDWRRISTNRYGIGILFLLHFCFGFIEEVFSKKSYLAITTMDYNTL